MLKTIATQEVVVAQEEEALHREMATTFRRQALRRAIPLQSVTVEAQDTRLLTDSTTHNSNNSNTNSQGDSMEVDSPKMATTLTINRDLTVSDVEECVRCTFDSDRHPFLPVFKQLTIVLGTIERHCVLSKKDCIAGGLYTSHSSFSISSCSSVLLTFFKVLSVGKGPATRGGGFNARTLRARSVMCSS